MKKLILAIIALLLISCSTDEPEKAEHSAVLETDKTSLTFNYDGGEQTITVTASDHFHIIPGDVWITAVKGTKINDETTVSIKADKNSTDQERRSILTIGLGQLRKSIEIIQAGKEASNDGDSPEVDASMIVALSFDDGPNNDTTPKVLDILEEFDIPASFFVIGQNINESTAKQMTRAISLGCEIQNHSFTHTQMSSMTTDQITGELKHTDDLVEQYTGIRPWLFRPPFLNHNKKMHDALEHTFISGISCRDWESGQSAQARFEELMPKVKDGDIILLHDFSGNEKTVEALKLIIPELKKRGFGFVTVSRLFEMKDVSPEPHSGFVYTNVMQTQAQIYRLQQI